MMKKFNWGHGIAIFYVCFVGIVIMVLIASFSVDRSLVVDDYYAKDLAYQERYDKINNSLSSDNVTIQTMTDEVVIKIDDTGVIHGTVQFYRASDKSQDFTKIINKNLLTFPTKTLVKGKWRIKIDYTSDGKSYYKEEEIYL